MQDIVTHVEGEANPYPKRLGRHLQTILYNDILKVGVTNPSLERVVLIVQPKPHIGTFEEGETYLSP